MAPVLAKLKAQQGLEIYWKIADSVTVRNKWCVMIHSCFAYIKMDVDTPAKQ